MAERVCEYGFPKLPLYSCQFPQVLVVLHCHCLWFHHGSSCLGRSGLTTLQPAAAPFHLAKGEPQPFWQMGLLGLLWSWSFCPTHGFFCLLSVQSYRIPTISGTKFCWSRTFASGWMIQFAFSRVLRLTHTGGRAWKLAVEYVEVEISGLSCQELDSWDSWSILRFSFMALKGTNLPTSKQLRDIVRYPPHTNWWPLVTPGDSVAFCAAASANDPRGLPQDGARVL